MDRIPSQIGATRQGGYVLTAGACHLDWSDFQDYLNFQFQNAKDNASRALDLASQAAHQFGNIMSTPGGPGCMGGLAAGGASAGATVGGGVGLVGLVGGGVGVVVTEPAGLVGGGIGGGASGLALGMTVCPGGAASGGGGTSGSRGSTGRGPQNLKEQLAVEQAKADPQAGTVAPVKGGMQDARWPGNQGWVKMRQNINGVEVHYVRNTITGAVDDFKVK